MSHIPNEVNDSSVHLAVDNRTECSGRRCLSDGPNCCLLPFGSLRAHLRTIDFVVRQRKDTAPSAITLSWAVQQREVVDAVKRRSTPIIVLLKFPTRDWIGSWQGLLVSTNSTSITGVPIDHIAALSSEKRWKRVITWLIGERRCSDRLLTPTQLAACQRRWVNDIWVLPLKDQAENIHILKGDIGTPKASVHSLYVSAWDSYPKDFVTHNGHVCTSSSVRK